MKVLSKQADKGKLAKLRKRFGSIAKVAALVPCSRPVIYFAMENPGRHSRVARRINELLKQS